MLSPRQQLLLKKVVDIFGRSGSPVSSKAIATDPEIPWGSSTVRSEFKTLESLGLLRHPHTSAGRVPTDSGYRYYVDYLVEPATRDSGLSRRALSHALIKREVQEAMRETSQTLSKLTGLLTVISAPSPSAATIRHIEVLALQSRVLMVVIITSTGAITKQIFEFEREVDPGLVDWARAYFNERLVGVDLGARTLKSRLQDRALTPLEWGFISQLAQIFDRLEGDSADVVYVEGATRLSNAYSIDISQLTALTAILERRVSLLSFLSEFLGERDTYVRIGHENELDALKTLSVVAANYGLPQRNLGTVSVIGPTHINYAVAMSAVSETARQLSQFVASIYDEN